MNKFDSANYPSSEPQAIVAGSRLAWKRPDITESYPTATFSLKYTLQRWGSTSDYIEIDAAKVSDEHVVTVDASVSAAYPSGEYAWQAVVVRDSDSAEVIEDEGVVTIYPAAGAADNTERGWVYLALEAIRATIARTATTDQQSFVVAGRELSRRTPEELMKLEREFSARWDWVKRDIDRQAGRPNSNRVLARMGA